jgi:hypothetical protein
MSLLPRRAFEFRTQLRPTQVADVLREMVEPRRLFRFRAGSRPFQGTVADSGFLIDRIISYRNSFLPQIRGTIQSEALGSRVAVVMELHPVVRAFMYLWFGGISLGGAVFLGNSITGQTSPVPVLFVGAMFLFGRILCHGAFSLEAKKAERLLLSLAAAMPQQVDSVLPNSAELG